MGWAMEVPGRARTWWKPTPRVGLRVALAVAEGLALLAVLALAHGLTPLWAVWALGVVIVLTDLDGRLARRVSTRLLDSAAQVIGRVAFAVLVLAAVARPDWSIDLPVVAAETAAAVLIARGLVVALLRACCRVGVVQHRVLLVGSGEIATRLSWAMHQHPSTGMHPVGAVHDDDDAALVVGVPRLGRLDDMERLARRQRVDRIVLAFSSRREAEMVRILVACQRLSADIYAVPRFFEVGVGAQAADDVSGIPLVLLPHPMQHRISMAMKRCFDIAGALIALTVLSPALVAVAAAVRCTGPRPFLGRRPVIFRQERVGLDGRHFMMLKFRSMIPNDDGDVTWSVVGDPRVTRLGSFLRRSGLDEAPQLWNVLRGDMSLVGPRPERPLMASTFSSCIPEYGDRQRVRPGITGWAQVNGLRGDTSIVDRARLDNYYMATWSLAADIVILVRTAALLVRHLLPRGVLRAPSSSTAWAADLRGIALPTQGVDTPGLRPASTANLSGVAQNSLLHADSG